MAAPNNEPVVSPEFAPNKETNGSPYYAPNEKSMEASNSNMLQLKKPPTRRNVLQIKNPMNALYNSSEDKTNQDSKMLQRKKSKITITYIPKR